MKLWAGEVTVAEVWVLAWASTAGSTTRVHTRLCDPRSSSGRSASGFRLIEEASQVLWEAIRTSRWGSWDWNLGPTGPRLAGIWPEITGKASTREKEPHLKNEWGLSTDPLFFFLKFFLYSQRLLKSMGKVLIFFVRPLKASRVPRTQQLLNRYLLD